MIEIKLTEKNMHTGNLILVNPQYPILNNQNVELIPVDESHPNILLERGSATVLSHILSDINSNNAIVPISGHRSLNDQINIYNSSLKENGQEFTKKYVAIPNHSEHQTGYAIDLAIKNDVIDFIRPDFPYNGISDIFRTTASKYGFIERYSSGKEAITGISHEPWHFRYVGYTHSTIITQNVMSLEEYIQYVKRYTYSGMHLTVGKGWQTTEIFYVPLLPNNQTTLFLPESCPYNISGNNVDGFIVTIWTIGGKINV